MTKSVDLVGAVLCGGESRRMGRSKAELVMPDGSTTLEHMVGLLRQCAGNVYLAGSAEQRLSISGPGILHVRDRELHRGPLSGLAAVLDALADSGTEARGVLLVGCDQPGLSLETLRQLTTMFDGERNVFFKKGPVVYPLPAVYCTRHLDIVRERNALGYGLKSVFEATQSIELVPDQQIETSLKGVNTPDEFKEFFSSLKF